MTPSTTTAALRRKVARLEAQLLALKQFLERDRESEYQTIRRNADMSARIEQAILILSGEES